MAGSWVLLHLANTRFAERVPAVRQNHWRITKTQKKNMDFGCAEFSQKIINGTHEIQSKGAKKNKKTAGNAGKNNQRK